MRDNAFDEPLNEQHRAPFERLLGGFMTAKVVETQPGSLILRVETIHTKYTEAERQAKEQGTLTVPCGVFGERLDPGKLVRCQKGLSPVLDEAWRHAHRGISTSSRIGEDGRPLAPDRSRVQDTDPRPPGAGFFCSLPIPR